MAVQRPMLEELEVEIGGAGEQRVGAGLAGHDGEDRDTDASDDAGATWRKDFDLLFARTG